MKNLLLFICLIMIMGTFSSCATNTRTTSNYKDYINVEDHPDEVVSKPVKPASLPEPENQKPFHIAQIVKLRKFYIEVNKELDPLSSRSPYLLTQGFQRTKVGELNMGFRLELGPVYQEHRVESIITANQFGTVSWEPEMGITAFGLDVYFRHKSLHCLDCRFDWGPTNQTYYPNTNMIGIRVNLIEFLEKEDE